MPHAHFDHKSPMVLNSRRASAADGVTVEARWKPLFGEEVVQVAKDEPVAGLECQAIELRFEHPRDSVGKPRRPGRLHLGKPYPWTSTTSMSPDLLATPSAKSRAVSFTKASSARRWISSGVKLRR